MATAANIYVTHHAVERFEERFNAEDWSQFRRKLSRLVTRDLLNFAGDAQFKLIIGDKMLVIQTQCVITIYRRLKPNRAQFRGAMARAIGHRRRDRAVTT